MNSEMLRAQLREGCPVKAPRLSVQSKRPQSSKKECETDCGYRMDLHEDAESNTVTATFDLPGLSKEAVNIDIHNSRLTISGENQSSQERMEKGYTVRERGYGRFSRALPLPPGTKVSDLQ